MAMRVKCSCRDHSNAVTLYGLAQAISSGSRWISALWRWLGGKSIKCFYSCRTLPNERSLRTLRQHECPCYRHSSCNLQTETCTAGGTLFPSRQSLPGAVRIPLGNASRHLPHRVLVRKAYSIPSRAATGFRKPWSRMVR